MNDRTQAKMPIPAKGVHGGAPAGRYTAQQGAVLLEALVAILVFSIGVLGLVGLQVMMLKNTSESNYRTQATYIAQQKLGEMWADPDNLAAYLAADEDISAQLPSGRFTVSLPGPGQVRIIVNWQAPGDPDVHNVTTNAWIVGG